MINRPKIVAHFSKQDVNQLVFMDVPKEHEFHRGLHESRLSKRLDLQSLPFVLDGGLSKKINNRKSSCETKEIVTIIIIIITIINSDTFIICAPGQPKCLSKLLLNNCTKLTYSVLRFLGSKTCTGSCGNDGGKKVLLFNLFVCCMFSPVRILLNYVKFNFTLKRTKTRD